MTRYDADDLRELAADARSLADAAEALAQMEAAEDVSFEQVLATMQYRDSCYAMAKAIADIAAQIDAQLPVEYRREAS